MTPTTADEGFSAQVAALGVRARLLTALERMAAAMQAVGDDPDPARACTLLGDELEQIADELKPNETIRIRRTGPILVAAIPLEGQPWRHWGVDSVTDVHRLGDWAGGDEDAARLFEAVLAHTVDASTLEGQRV